MADGTASGIGTLIVAPILCTLIAIPLTIAAAWQAAGRSVDTDLLSRGLGFGFRGSALTAVAYAMNWIVYAGFETVFLGAAIHKQWDAPPLWLLYAVAAFIVVPLNWYGISQLHWLQKWTVPLFFVGLIWVSIEAFGNPAVSVAGAHIGFDTVLPALGAVLTNVGIWILLLADFSRFVRSEERKRAMWTISFYGWTPTSSPSPLGGFLALHAGSANPGTYAVQLTGVGGLIWVIITQIRVQEGNRGPPREGPDLHGRTALRVGRHPRHEHRGRAPSAGER